MTKSAKKSQNGNKRHFSPLTFQLALKLHNGLYQILQHKLIFSYLLKVTKKVKESAK